jgi:hypothetical protein
VPEATGIEFSTQTTKHRAIGKTIDIPTTPQELFLLCEGPSQGSILKKIKKVLTLGDVI